MEKVTIYGPNIIKQSRLWLKQNTHKYHPVWYIYESLWTSHSLYMWWLPLQLFILKKDGNGYVDT